MSTPKRRGKTREKSKTFSLPLSAVELAALTAVKSALNVTTLSEAARICILTTHKMLEIDEP